MSQRVSGETSGAEARCVGWIESPKNRGGPRDGPRCATKPVCFLWLVKKAARIRFLGHDKGSIGPGSINSSLLVPRIILRCLTVSAFCCSDIWQGFPLRIGTVLKYPELEAVPARFHSSFVPRVRPYPPSPSCGDRDARDHIASNRLISPPLLPAALLLATVWDLMRCSSVGLLWSVF